MTVGLSRVLWPRPRLGGNGTTVGVEPCDPPSVISAPDPTTSWDYYFALDRTRPLYKP